jgi:hypothetical protein
MIMIEPISPSNKLYIILKINKLLFIICLISIILLLLSLLFILCKIILILILSIIKLIRRRYFNNQNNEECSICLEPINSNNMIITYCNHTFHDSCIKQMLYYNNKCPLCRRIL